LYLNIKRTSVNGIDLGTNVAMPRVPELISNAVFFYMITRHDPYELCFALQNCVDMVMNSARFDSKKWEDFELANMPMEQDEPMDVI